MSQRPRLWGVARPFLQVWTLKGVALCSPLPFLGPLLQACDYLRVWAVGEGL